ncbi:hypothetical protein AVEN_194999-1 [Araneus ventricosus]|uniref:Uncharacterized protein n=1 Tax=Araneus ventricosus TaxID=182803 RepID=A0A4Y2HP33_ARAVE|nr:hypothetical protein AVEN_194999-1 [Araneus ventricosus]
MGVRLAPDFLFELCGGERPVSCGIKGVGELRAVPGGTAQSLYFNGSARMRLPFTHYFATGALSAMCQRLAPSVFFTSCSCYTIRMFGGDHEQSPTTRLNDSRYRIFSGRVP